MEFTSTQIFDLTIIAFTLLYIVICKISTQQLMPRVNYAYAIKGQVDRILSRSKWRLFLQAPFIVVCMGFVVCRAIIFLYSIDVEAWAAWFVCILLGFYAVNILVFYTAFRIIARSVVLPSSSAQG
jgi:hypothetical protein